MHRFERGALQSFSHVTWFIFPDAPTHRPDELYRVPTDDGAAISLGRYFPKGEVHRSHPVVLCHGLFTNRYAMDFDEHRSLARFLAREGFETWVLELRGRGVAGKPAGATCDEQARYDVAAAIKTVTSTGPREVLWVGHSKGALLAFAHAGLNPLVPIRALVAIASPVHFDAHPGVRRFVKAVRPFLHLEAIPLASAAKVAAPFGLPRHALFEHALNLDNVEGSTVRRALAHTVADIQTGVARQFVRWVENDTFDANDGFNYREGMRSLRAPVMLLSGAADKLAPTSSVEAARKYLGHVVESRTLGRATGSWVDYGHGDLLLGRHAPHDVFPVVAAFLRRYSAPKGL